MNGSPWVVHISASPPMAFGWAVVYWQTEAKPSVVLDGYGSVASDELTDMILRAETLYHRVIGPSSDEFVFTVWAFETLEDMFRTCGPHLYATTGVIPDWSYH